jgi:hypothetical protein
MARLSCQEFGVGLDIVIILILALDVVVEERRLTSVFTARRSCIYSLELS